jgi:hypothetical protein
MVRAPTAADAGRGRIGLAGEPVGRLKRARKGTKRAGKPCSPREETSGELTGEGEAVVMEFDSDDGLGGAPAGGNPSSKHRTTLVTAFPGQQAPREGNDHVRGRKG